MKTIYTAETLNLMSQLNGIENVNNLVKTGAVKELENGVKYLVVEE